MSAVEVKNLVNLLGPVIGRKDTAIKTHVSRGKGEVTLRSVATGK
jgi:hypothetical protein